MKTKNAWQLQLDKTRKANPKVKDVAQIARLAKKDYVPMPVKKR